MFRIFFLFHFGLKHVLCTKKINGAISIREFSFTDIFLRKARNKIKNKNTAHVYSAGLLRYEYHMGLV